MNKQKAKKIAEIFANPEAEEKLSNAGSIENMVIIFAEYGVELTTDDLNQMLGTDNDGELSEELLEDVAGGKVNWKRVWGKIKSAANDFLDGFLSYK